jgi:hypothetical protein
LGGLVCLPYLLVILWLLVVHQALLVMVVEVVLVDLEQAQHL